MHLRSEPRDDGTDIRTLVVPALVCVVLGYRAVFTVFFYLPRGGLGYDAHAYWLAGQTAHPYGGQVGSHDAFLYSPVFAQVMHVLGLLPFPVFYALWFAVELAAFWWLTAPVKWPWRLPILLLCVPELLIGNIYGLLGLVAVLGLQRPGLWAFALLTKVTTGLAGLVWFGVRGDWRSVLRIGMWTALVMGASALIQPQLWREWFEFLLHGHDGEPFTTKALRMGLAVAFVAWGALSSRAWTIPVSMLFLAPHFGFSDKDVAMLAPIPRLAKTDVPQLRHGADD